MADGNYGKLLLQGPIDVQFNCVVLLHPQNVMAVLLYTASGTFPCNNVDVRAIPLTPPGNLTLTRQKTLSGRNTETDIIQCFIQNENESPSSSRSPFINAMKKLWG